MAHKQQYESLPGKDGGEPAMANKGEPVVLSQPTKLSATEEYVLNLDPNEVAGKFIIFYTNLSVALNLCLKIMPLASIDWKVLDSSCAVEHGGT